MHAKAASLWHYETKNKEATSSVWFVPTFPFIVCYWASFTSSVLSTYFFFIQSLPIISLKIPLVLSLIPCLLSLMPIWNNCILHGCLMFVFYEHTCLYKTIINLWSIECAYRHKMHLCGQFLKIDYGLWIYFSWEVEQHCTNALNTLFMSCNIPP